MIRLFSLFARAGLLGGVALLAGCAPSAPASHATTAQLAACRQRADQVFEQQNRGAVYQADMYASSTRDAPFGSSGLLGSSSGLSDRYARDKIQSDCIDGINGAPGPVPGAAAPVTGPAQK